MERESQSEDSSLYARVLQRLSSALQEAERGESGAAGELEVGGLTPAEFELIRAYLQRDSQWLSGWRAWWRAAAPWRTPQACAAAPAAEPQLRALQYQGDLAGRCRACDVSGLRLAAATCTATSADLPAPLSAPCADKSADSR